MTLSGGSLTSGTSSALSHGTWSSGSQGGMEVQAQMDLKRKRRKESNRESAKRSRLRKQQHVDDLTSQVNQLMMQKKQLTTTLNMTTQSYAAVETQNSVLRTQMMELQSRLCALRDIIFYMDNSNRLANAATAATYPSMMMTATNAGYDIFGANNGWSTGIQMMQHPIDLLYH